MATLQIVMIVMGVLTVAVNLVFAIVSAIEHRSPWVSIWLALVALACTLGLALAG